MWHAVVAPLHCFCVCRSLSPVVAVLCERRNRNQTKPIVYLFGLVDIIPVIPYAYLGNRGPSSQRRGVRRGNRQLEDYLGLISFHRPKVPFQVAGMPTKFTIRRSRTHTEGIPSLQGDSDGRDDDGGARKTRQNVSGASE